MNNRNKLRVISRGSLLAKRQVEEVFEQLPGVNYVLTSIESFGDKNKHIALTDNSIPNDFFTRELDEMLLDNRADVAVHSAKDLPYPLPAGIALYALTQGKDKTDSLVSRDNLGLSQLPNGARVGTSSATREAELLNLRPDLTIINIRGTIQERIAMVDNGYIDALIVATCALDRLGLTNRIAEILPFETHPLQGNLAITGRTDNNELRALFSDLDIHKKYGKVKLVGFGPGNPELLTIVGDKALAGADIIFYDALLDSKSLDKYSAEKVYVGKRSKKHSFSQSEINRLVYQAAVCGKNVVRLKGGDPMIFAHGREEIDYLQSRFVKVEVIPGISSGVAAAAYTNIPLTHRGVSSSVAFVSGHSEKQIQVPQADTLVYYMPGENISIIAKELIAAGRSDQTPVALIHNVSLESQRNFFTTLGEMQFSTIKYPTPVIALVGDVVSFESECGVPNLGRTKS